MHLLHSRHVLLALMATRMASAQQPATPTPGPVTYTFLERLGGTPPVILEGQFTVLGDSVWVAAIWAPCIRAEATSRTKIVYECGRVILAFDRFDPVRRASYEAPVMVTERVEVCEEYGRDAGGRQVCVRMRRETVDKEVPRSGRINPKRTGG